MSIDLSGRPGASSEASTVPPQPPATERPEPMASPRPAVGPQLVIPTQPVLEKRSYASPMSYVGGTRRVLAWVRRVGERGVVPAILAWTAAVIGLAAFYALLIGWYFLIFLIFGVITFPYRLIRRSQRKQEHLQRTQLATMQAMLVQRQQAMIQNTGQGFSQ